MKNMQAMKKLSLNSTIRSNPSHAHPVAVAEKGVIDDRVVQHHQQSDEGARRGPAGTMRSVAITVRPPATRVFAASLFKRVVNDLLQRYLDVHAPGWGVLHHNEKHVLGPIDHEIDTGGAVPFDLAERAPAAAAPQCRDRCGCRKP